MMRVPCHSTCGGSTPHHPRRDCYNGRPQSFSPDLSAGRVIFAIEEPLGTATQMLPSKKVPRGPMPTRTARGTPVLSCGGLMAVDWPLFATHTWEPSNARSEGLSPTAIWLKMAPSFRRSLAAVFSDEKITHVAVPRKECHPVALSNSIVAWAPHRLPTGR